MGDSQDANLLEACDGVTVCVAEPIPTLWRQFANMPTNREIDKRWIAAWNELFAIVGTRWDAPCQLPDYSVVDIEACKGWIQDAVYDGQQVSVEAGWIAGKHGAILTIAEN